MKKPCDGDDRFGPCPNSVNVLRSSVGPHYCTACRRRQTPTAPPRVLIQVRVPGAVAETLKHRATRDGLSFNEFALRTIQKGLEL